MDTLYQETFKYAKIKVFKNYSNLNQKVVVYDTKQIDPFTALTTDPFIPSTKTRTIRDFTVSSDPRRGLNDRLYNLNLYKKNPRSYFYTNKPTDSFINHAKKGTPVVEVDVVKLVNTKRIWRSNTYSPDYYETTKDKHIKNHYYRPFSEITVTIFDRWIKRDGNTIKVKYFRQDKTRDVGQKYFKKTTHSVTIVFDMVKGNFLVVTYDSHKKKKTKHFFKNSFISLETSLRSILNANESGISKLSPMSEEHKKTFNQNLFYEKLSGALNIPQISYDFRNEVTIKNIMELWVQKFAKLKEIKMPDNGINLIKNLYPTEVYLKKNDRKLVASILDRFNIKSKFAIKLLHKYPNMNIEVLIKLCNLFGDNASKYLGNIKEDFFIKQQNNGMVNGLTYSHLKEDRFLRNLKENFDIKDFEKENVVHILNSCGTNGVQLRLFGHTGIFDSIIDHFRMMENLRQYYPELRLNVVKADTFNIEHSRLSSLERNVKKGYSIHCLYGTEIIIEIEKPIEILYSAEPFKTDGARQLDEFIPQQKIYTPVLLKTSEDYDSEGAYMHHCVAGYIGNERSIIVSLRCGDERVTCEYEIKTRRCIQARSTQNANPPEHFKKPLEILDQRIKSIPFSIEPRERVRVPLTINGIPVQGKLPLDELVLVENDFEDLF